MRPDEAANYIINSQGSEYKNCIEVVTGVIAKHNGVSAIAWVKLFPAGDMYDNAALSVIRYTAGTDDNARAFELISKIHNEETRKLANDVIVEWKEKLKIINGK